MDRQQKERQVEELADWLRGSETLIVADYRGLTMPQIDALRGRLLEQGARFHVVKNTLTRRAAELAGADAVLALLEGPTAIAFVESEGDPVAVAKALQDAARETQVIAVRGGVLQGRTITSEDVAELAKLPPVDVLRGQVLGAITAPLMAIVGLFTAPLRDLVGLIDARIEQLEAQGASAGEPAGEPEAPVAPTEQAETTETAEPAEVADTADTAEPTEAAEPAAEEQEATETATEEEESE